MTRIEKKAWPDLFEDVLQGTKKFDVRVADFGVKEGDELVMREWDPKTKEYTGREVSTKVTYVLKTKGQTFWPQEDIDKYGFQIIQFDR